MPYCSTTFLEKKTPKSPHGGKIYVRPNNSPGIIHPCPQKNQKIITEGKSLGTLFFSKQECEF
jgi:hypothetical protein